MTHLVRDVKLAVRRVLKAPGFSLTVVSLLALGIGTTTALFSVVDGVLLRPLLCRLATSVPPRRLHTARKARADRGAA